MMRGGSQIMSATKREARGVRVFINADIGWQRGKEGLAHANIGW